MISTIIFDLDGPLLEGKYRHYQCYSDILEEHGFVPMPMETYWQMKRSGLQGKALLAETGAELFQRDFLAAWLNRIELPAMLALDSLQPGAMDKLRELKSKNKRLVLATQRRFPASTRDQLKVLGIEELFDDIIICAQNNGETPKVREVKRCLYDLKPTDCLWVGDTEIDFNAARAFGSQVCLVTEGLRDEVCLRNLNPDYLVRYIADFDFDLLGEPSDNG